MKFYFLEEYYPEPATSRIDDLLLPYRLFRLLANTDDYCARVLEDIVRASFIEAGGYRFIGKGDKSEPLDGIYEIQGEQVGAEVKNAREWIYPKSRDIWVMIRKCLRLDAVPIPFLIARKTAFLTRNMLDEMGVMHFQVWRQVFARRVAHLLTDIQHTDKLGYKDVIATDVTPNPHLVAYLRNVLPQQLAAYRTRWNSKRALLWEFAIDRDLGNKEMKDSERHKHYEDLRAQLYQPEPDEDGELDDDDYDQD